MTTRLLQPATIFLIVIFICRTAATNKKPSCPNIPNNSSALKWTKRPANEHFVCKGRYTELLCCASGYAAIHWYYQTSDSSIGGKGPIFQPLESYNDPNDPHIWTEEGNQTLVITKAIAGKNWQCVVFGSNGAKKEHTIKLFVIDCGETVAKPIKVTPKEETIPALRGKDLTINCSGIFGSSGDLKEDRNSIRWKKRMPEGRPKIFQNDCPAKKINSSYIMYDPRICVKVTKIYGGNLKSELIIENVQDSDFGDYICQMNNGVSGGITDVNITIEEEKDRQ